MEVVKRSKRDNLPLHLLSCESWMFVKENPDRKKKLFVPISNVFINPFQANVPFLYPLKTSENLVFFCDCLYLAYFHHYLLLSHSRLEKQLKEQFLRKLFLVCPRKLFRSWSYASWIRNFSYFV